MCNPGHVRPKVQCGHTVDNSKPYKHFANCEIYSHDASILTHMQHKPCHHAEHSTSTVQQQLSIKLPAGHQNFVCALHAHCPMKQPNIPACPCVLCALSPSPRPHSCPELRFKRWQECGNFAIMRDLKRNRVDLRFPVAQIMTRDGGRGPTEESRHEIGARDGGKEGGQAGGWGRRRADRGERKEKALAENHPLSGGSTQEGERWRL